MKKIIEYSALWCAPCKMMKPIMEELKQEGYDVEIVNIEENPVEDITSVSTFKFFEDGEHVDTLIGARL
jgi:thioredoxin 1